MKTIKTLKMKIKELIKILGFKDVNDFETKTNMTLAEHWRETSFLLHYKDPFQLSVLSGRVAIEISNKNNTEIIAEFNKKLRYKRSKVSKIEVMRLVIQKELHEKLNLWFKIDPLLIKDSDFVFEAYGDIKIGEAKLHFSSTFSSKSISLNKYIYTYERAEKMLSDLYEFYYDKTLKEIIGELSKN